jgi:hypothetical protein
MEKPQQDPVAINNVSLVNVVYRSVKPGWRQKTFFFYLCSVCLLRHSNPVGRWGHTALRPTESWGRDRKYKTEAPPHCSPHRKHGILGEINSKDWNEM